MLLLSCNFRLSSMHCASLDCRLDVCRGHSMAVVQGEVRFDKIAEKWHALAQRRLACIRELERSGRWKRYCTKEQFASYLAEAEHAVMLWAKLATERPQPLLRKGILRPAA